MISASVTLVGGIPSSLSNKVWRLLAKRFLSIIKHKKRIISVYLIRVKENEG